MGAQCSASDETNGHANEEITYDSLPSQAKPQRGADWGGFSCAGQSHRGPSEAVPPEDNTQGGGLKDMEEVPVAIASEKMTVDPIEWNAMMATVNSLVLPPIRGPDAAETQGLVDTDTDNGSSEKGSSDGEGEFRLPWAARAAQKRSELDEEATKDDAFEHLREGRPLYTLPEAMRADKEVVLCAISAEGAFCFNYIASEELQRRDREVGLALVAANGSLLEELCEELRADRLVVETAVRNSAEALRSASKELQADKELKAIAAAREKEEKRLLKHYMEKACGPGLTRCF